MMRRTPSRRTTRRKDPPQKPSKIGYIILQREIAGTIREAYPDVEQIIVSGQSTNFDVQRFTVDISKSYEPEDKLFFEIDCPNRDCYHGRNNHSGYYITEAIKDGLDEHLTVFPVNAGCRGWASENYINVAHCNCVLEAQAAVRYRKETGQ